MIPEPPALGLRERKQKRTKDAIWNAAIDLFAEKGFEETTIDEIADAAEISRRSFFRYFESKSDLMAQPIANLTVSLSDAVDACPRSYSKAQLLQHVVLTLARESASEPRTVKVMEIVARCPAAREAMASRLSSVREQIEDAFGRRCKDAFTVQVLSSLAVSALGLATQRWFATGQDISKTVREVFASIAKVTSGLDE
jgi:AcrR family transcriptional regulator